MLRSIISSLLLFSLLIMGCTGLLMFLLPHASTTALLHLIFGLLFLLLCGFHLNNNFRAIKSYATAGKSGASPFNRKFAFILILISALTVATYLQLPPMRTLYEWGTAFRLAQDGAKTIESHTIVVHHKNENEGGDALVVEVLKGPYFRWPTYAIWIEDTLGNYLQTLYVTEKLAKNNFYVKVVTVDGKDQFLAEPESKGDRERPEALPIWSHKYGKRSAKGNYIPSGQDVIPDAYSGATLTTDFRLETKTPQALPDVYRVRLEINQSFDWNEYYPSDRFPEDPVYSGNGKPGQPSLLYEALVTKNSTTKVFAFALAGRGHHSGKDGVVYTELDGITTARGIIKRTLVELPEPTAYGKDSFPYDPKK